MKRFALLALCTIAALGCRSGNNPYTRTVPYFVSYQFNDGNQRSGFGNIVLRPGYSVQGPTEAEIGAMRTAIEGDLAKQKDKVGSDGKTPTVVIMNFRPLERE